MFFNLFFAIYEFLFHLFNVNFSEPMGYYMMYFIDVYFAAFYYLTLIVIFVFWSTFAIVWQFYYKQVINPSSIDIEMRDELLSFSRVTHNEELEFWWTIIPSVIIFFIALPALLLLYAIESPLDEPVITVKVIGHQWYWSYEYTDKLDKSIYGSYADKSVSIDSYRVPDSELTLGCQSKPKSA
jgi:cytochrome c oxidase subunit 2